MRCLLPVAAALALALPAQAADARSGALEALQPWSRPAAAGTTGVGFMTLVNRGATADALVGAESPVARKVEMHATSMAGGVMRMTPEARVPLPAGGQVVFAPGGRHLMLRELTRPLKAGDRVPATLAFASGARLKVEFVVTAPGAPAMGHMPMRR